VEPKRQQEAIQWSAAALIGIGLVVGAHQGTFVGIEGSFDPHSGELAALAEAKAVIQSRWVETPSDGQLRDGALDGMARTLDAFSAYIPPVETKEFTDSTTGVFGGLGILIGLDKGQVVVVCPMEGTPAWKAGLLPGDRVVKVNGVASTFKTVEEAVGVLKGKVGSSIELQVARSGSEELQTFRVERAQIQIHSVKGTRLLDPQTKIGYLRLTTFNGATFEDTKAAAERLVKQGMRGLILDLRDNPGGLLDQAVRVANLWLEDDAVILSTWSREQALERGDVRASAGSEGDKFPASGYQHTVANALQVVKVPTVILIDGGSASASEVLGGALHDHEKAYMIGTRSYGKGSVQTIISLQGGKAALKLTTQYYFTPGRLDPATGKRLKRRRIHRGSLPDTDLSWGLIPDQVVEVSAEVAQRTARQEADFELEMLKAKARKVPFQGEERLHIDDPQARSAYRHLLETLGDPLPAETAPVGSGSVGGVESGTAPVGSQQPSGSKEKGK
jgi:carboxyl-terminal processing protease